MLTNDDVSPVHTPPDFDPLVRECGTRTDGMKAQEWGGGIAVRPNVARAAFEVSIHRSLRAAACWTLSSWAGRSVFG